MLQVVDLRCEYRSNPLGMDVDVPRFSWTLSSALRDVVQTRYELEVTEVATGRMMWESGKVHGEDSNLVAYRGLPLEPCTAYEWHVRVATRQEKSAWSAPARFETGLMDPHGWQAQWIGTGEASLEPTKLPLLRKSFNLPGVVRSARVYASALGIYKLNINGQPVGNDLFTPGWTCYDERIQYQCYDVTSLLKSGDNAVGVMLGDGWYHSEIMRHHIKRNYGDALAALVQLDVVMEDGSHVLVLSDTSWKWHRSFIVTSDFYLGETYDATLEAPGWDTPGFNDNEWTGCQIVEHSMDVLIAQEGIPAREQELLKPIALLTTPKGETVLDMGPEYGGLYALYRGWAQGACAVPAPCRGAGQGW